MGKVSIKYREITDALRHEILSGRYSRQNPFPSIVAVCKRFKISRLTAFKVFDGLKEEGLIASRSGSGTYVTKSGSSRTIGLILAGSSRYEYFRPVASELSRLALDAEYALLFSNVDSSSMSECRRKIRELAADCIKRRIAGVIFHPMEFADKDDSTNAEVVSAFDHARIPVVLFDSDIFAPPDESEHDVVSIDNFAAAERVTNHLYDAGARNVHLLMLPEWLPNGKNRERGFLSALALHHVRHPVSHILVARPNDLNAVRKYMCRRPRPDAFVCQHDEVAAVFKQTLEKLNLRVPEDVMLAGFDGLEISRLVSPPLTTIYQPYDKVAQTIFQRLIQRMANPDLPPTRFYLQGRLLLRESTKRILTMKRRTIPNKEDKR